MRALPVLFLLLATAAAQERTAGEILLDHGRAVGDVASVQTLGALLDTGDGNTTVKGANAAWALPGRCMRSIPIPKGPPLREYFGPDGAFLERGYFERWRPDQRTTRGGYYLFQALAEPFPLRTYLLEPNADKALGVARAEGHEVLVGPRDEQGVRVIYLLDAKTHLVSRVRYEIAENRAFVEVRYEDYRDVGGVQLPHLVDANFFMIHEDAETSRLAVLPRRARREAIHRWEINPEIDPARLVPPGRSEREAQGFTRTVHATGPNPYELAAGDIDGDGQVDFAVACDGAVYVHFAGAFDRPVRVALADGQCRGLVVDDLDGDGRPEIVTTSNVHPSKTFFVVRFDAKRTPEVSSLYGAPHFTHALVAHDLDRDGVPDLAATGYEGQRELAVKFGNGLGAFRRTGTSWPLNADSRDRRGLGLAVGNVDGNRYRDIAVADGKRVVVFLGQVNGAFQPRISIPEGAVPKVEWRPVAVAFADLDGDGDDDLLVAREHPTRDLPGDLIVIANEKGRLSVTKHLNAGDRIQALATGRFDANPHPDLLVPSFLAGEIAVLAGDGKGGFADPVRMASGRGACRLAVFDLDGNGGDDFLVTNRLDDSVAVFRNASGGAVRRPPARARAVPPPTRHDFRLEGLSDPYEFAGSFRIPAGIRDPSGIACLGADGVHVQFVFVSDKRSALFRGVLDRARARFLVGPPIPLAGLERERLDLEGATFDASGNLFLASEADSSLLRVSLFGDVVARVATGIESGGNDGIEAIAARRLKDGTPLLYVFKERNGTTGTQPVVRAYGLEENPFALVPRGLERKLPTLILDQTGATVFDDRLFVVHRIARTIVELAFKDDGFDPEGVKSASYLTLVNALGLTSPRHPLFGMAEGLAIDPYAGDLFLLLDNNRETIGKRELGNRGAEGRLLWFRNLGAPAGRSQPARVTFRHLRVAFLGARASEGVTRDREKAARRARAILERLRAGEDLEFLTRKYHDAVDALPPEIPVVIGALEPRPGEFRQSRLPTALSRLAFNLEVGEAGLCEFHHVESPYGFHIVRRTK